MSELERLVAIRDETALRAKEAQKDLDEFLLANPPEMYRVLESPPRVQEKSCL